MKRCFIDTETTGTDPQKHGIWQIAGIVTIEKKIVQRFTHTFVPHEGTVWDQTARDMVPPDTLAKIDAVSIAFDSWGGDPFTIWLDGLAFQ